MNIEELSYHLLFQCPFHSECWNYLGFNWDHSIYFFDTIQRLNRTFTWTSWKYSQLQPEKSENKEM
jgi:hypothetical protein